MANKIPIIPAAMCICPDHGVCLFFWFKDTNTGYCAVCDYFSRPKEA